MNIPKKHTLRVDTLRISYKRRFWSILNPFKFFGRTIDPCNKQFCFTSLRWKHSKIEIKQKNSLVQTWHIPSRYGTFTYIYSSWFLWPPVDKCTSPMDPIGMYDYIYIYVSYIWLSNWIIFPQVSGLKNPQIKTNVWLRHSQRRSPVSGGIISHLQLCNNNKSNSHNRRWRKKHSQNIQTYFP